LKESVVTIPRGAYRQRLTSSARLAPGIVSNEALQRTRWRGPLNLVVELNRFAVGWPCGASRGSRGLGHPYLSHRFRRAILGVIPRGVRRLTSPSVGRYPGLRRFPGRD
jgi:hypothetical protein